MDLGRRLGWRWAWWLALAVPLVAVIALGAKVLGDEQSRRLEAQRELGRVMVDGWLALWDARLTREVARLEALPAWTSPTAEALRELGRTDPWVAHAFLLSPEGEVLYPNPAELLSTSEREFLMRTRQLWEARALLAPPPEDPPSQAPARSFESKLGKRSVPAAEPSSERGWYTWFWEDGVRVIRWQRQPDKRTVGVELAPARVLTELIASLPANAEPDRRGRIKGPRGELMHQWGGLSPEPQQAPVAARALPAPLEVWSLELLLSPATAGATGWLAIAGALLGLVTVAAALGVLAFREGSREIKEAGQRVSFVNQVSHELKTPLTNIRMYAELLQEELDGHDGLPDATGRQLGIIVAESQRLSRLIGNVLTFAGKHRPRLQVSTCDLDDLVREVAEQFAPAFAARGIGAQLDLHASGPQRLDRDRVEQILANLLSNAEKYASGAPVRVISARDGDGCRVEVIDGGPGIPWEHRHRIFLPFERLHGTLTEGVSGAGLGLALARDLARLHGGDLTLEPSLTGARFVLTLKAVEV